MVFYRIDLVLALQAIYLITLLKICENLGFPRVFSLFESTITLCKGALKKMGMNAEGPGGSIFIGGGGVLIGYDLKTKNDKLYMIDQQYAHCKFEVESLYREREFHGIKDTYTQELTSQIQERKQKMNDLLEIRNDVHGDLTAQALGVYGSAAEIVKDLIH